MPTDNLLDITNKLLATNAPKQVVQSNAPVKVEPTFTKKASLGELLVQRDPQRAKEKNLDLVSYDVPFTSIYDRLSDGSYVAKYENYIGAEGNEDRLAKEQSTSQKWGRGLAKFGAKTLNYALDSTVGTLYGIAAGIGEGSFEKVYDNDFANWMDDTNKKLDNNLANYYTDEEKSMGFLKSLTTANFWANDVGGGLAFVAGAVLPSIALGALSGGATVAGGLGKSFAKAAAKDLIEEGGEAAIKKGLLGGIADATGYTAGRAVTKARIQAKLGAGLGSVVDKGLFIARTSNFEAGMEARQSFKEATDSFYTNFQEKNGRLPTYEETTSFMDEARSASNAVYGVNMALLSASNAVMFGKKLLPDMITKPFSGLSKLGNRAIGLGTKSEIVDGVLVKSMRGANRAQKILGNAVIYSKKPLTEGLFEEGLQGVTQKAASDYLEAKYDNRNLTGYTGWSSIHDAFTDQYSSKDGWKEMGIGIIIGLLGGGVNPEAWKSGNVIEGLGKSSRKSRQADIASGLVRSNQGIENLASLNRVSAVQAMSEAAQSGASPWKKTGRRSWDSGVDTDSFEGTAANLAFIRSQEHLNSLSELKDDHHVVINNMVIDESHNPEIYDALNNAGITVDAYKNGLKTDFEKDVKNYMDAKETVALLGLSKTLKDTPGDLAEISEALVIQHMFGTGALESARKTSENLDKILGTSGIYNHLAHYEGLGVEAKAKIEEQSQAKKELAKAQKRAIEYGQALAGLAVPTIKTSDNKKLDSSRKKLSLKAVVEQANITRLTERIANLNKAIASEFEGAKFTLDAKDPYSHETSMFDTLEQLDKISKLKESLRLAGKTKELNSINYLEGQVKAHLTVHRETDNTYRRMLETNFFSSKEGHGMLNRLRGRKYEMSDEFKALIKENEAELDASLKLVGLKGYDSVEGKFQEAITDNENLSQREKYRYESIIRLNMTKSVVENMAKVLGESYNMVADVTQSDMGYEIEGDQVVLNQSLDLEGKDLSNVQVLSKAIEDITAQLDYVVNSDTKNAEEIAKLKIQIDKLNKQRDAIKEKQEQEKIKREQGSSSEYTGTDQVEQNEEPLQETSDETNTSDSNITVKTQEVGRTISPESRVVLDILEKVKSGERLSETEATIALEHFISVKENIEQVASSEEETSRRGLTEEYLQEVLDVVEKEIKFFTSYKLSLELGDNLPTTFRHVDESEYTSVSNLELDLGLQDKLIKNKLEAIDAKLKLAQEKLDLLDKDTFRIITSEEYIRYKELLKKRAKKELTKLEETELKQLKQDLDQWTFITGTVVEGFRLSDLIQQKVVLEETPITEMAEVALPVTQDTLDVVDIDDAAVKANYKFGLVYDRALASVSGDMVILHYIKEEQLLDHIKDVRDEDGNPIVINRDERNNLVITKDDVALINAQSNIRILSTNEKFKTKYPAILKVTPAEFTLTGVEQVEPLTTLFSKEFNGGQGHSVQAIYNSKANDKLTLTIDLSDDHNRNEIAKYKNATKGVKAKKKLQEAKNILKAQLLIQVKDAQGNSVSTLKGLKGGVMNNSSDNTHIALRNAVVDNEAFIEKLLKGGVEGVHNVMVEDADGNFTEPLVRVQQVLLGQPNYNYVTTEEGNIGVEFQPIPESQMDKVIDIGYSEGGKTFTKEHETVNTTFLTTLTKKNPKTKIPFIVVQIGSQKVAYPVKVASRETPNTQEFEDTFHSDALDIDKVNSLNRQLAAKGVDIKKPGEAFITFGQSNLTEEFFNDRLAKLKSMNYFYEVGEWISSETDIKDVIRTQITVDIKVDKPLHSPKLSFDYDGLSLKNTKVETFKEEGKSKTADEAFTRESVDDMLEC
jgi:hypothetical protein